MDIHPIRRRLSRRKTITNVATAGISGAAGGIAGAFTQDPLIAAGVSNATAEALKAVLGSYEANTDMSDPHQADAFAVFSERLARAVELDLDATAKLRKLHYLLNVKDLKDEDLYMHGYELISQRDQNVTSKALMDGLARQVLASVELDDEQQSDHAEAFEFAMRSARAMSDRQLILLAVLSSNDPEDSLSVFVPSMHSIGHYKRIEPRLHKFIARNQEILQMIRDDLVYQDPSHRKESVFEHQQRIRSEQPQSWTEIEPERIRLTSVGHMLAEQMGLHDLELELKQQLLGELDPLGQEFKRIRLEAEAERGPYWMDEPEEVQQPQLKRLKHQTQPHIDSQPTGTHELDS